MGMVVTEKIVLNLMDWQLDLLLKLMTYVKFL